MHSKQIAKAMKIILFIGLFILSAGHLSAQEIKYESEVNRKHALKVEFHSSPVSDLRGQDKMSFIEILQEAQNYLRHDLISELRVSSSSLQIKGQINYDRINNLDKFSDDSDRDELNQKFSKLYGDWWAGKTGVFKLEYLKMI